MNMDHDHRHLYRPSSSAEIQWLIYKKPTVFRDILLSLLPIAERTLALTDRTVHFFFSVSQLASWDTNLDMQR